ncbi:uncharacterized protein LOC119661878 [Teleopsis dalmanni]|uniref:uncharacterized protein LOC119661878 n=1 Tax=Teleopsis dalmanni TaxID=139649 RepID=UPI0018CEB436|nr:uncharacterized protein LOC119661878 [Teleopsis dalmanni]XP_037927312.1 uncharacterized protein LOC119661878 [Teleopsis dalmanni]
MMENSNRKYFSGRYAQTSTPPRSRPNPYRSQQRAADKKSETTKVVDYALHAASGWPIHGSRGYFKAAENCAMGGSFDGFFREAENTTENRSKYFGPGGLNVYDDEDKSGKQKSAPSPSPSPQMGCGKKFRNASNQYGNKESPPRHYTVKNYLAKR